MSSEMVERVAAAIWASEGFAKMHPEGFAGRPSFVRDNYLRNARAAIEAMRDPPKAVLDALYDFEYGPDENLESWQSAIDAALTTEGTRRE